MKITRKGTSSAGKIADPRIDPESPAHGNCAMGGQFADPGANAGLLANAKPCRYRGTDEIQPPKSNHKSNHPGKSCAVH
jgi:hypothetical protein